MDYSIYAREIECFNALEMFATKIQNPDEKRPLIVSLLLKETIKKIQEEINAIKRTLMNYDEPDVVRSTKMQRKE
jgi:hypothetical protein